MEEEEGAPFQRAKVAHHLVWGPTTENPYPPPLLRPVSAHCLGGPASVSVCVSVLWGGGGVSVPLPLPLRNPVRKEM